LVFRQVFLPFDFNYFFDGKKMWLYIEKSDKRMDNDAFKGKQRDNVNKAKPPSQVMYV
jgi:hypothetical protein